MDSRPAPGPAPAALGKVPVILLGACSHRGGRLLEKPHPTEKLPSPREGDPSWGMPPHSSIWNFCSGTSSPHDQKGTDLTDHPAQTLVHRRQE